MDLRAALRPLPLVLVFLFAAVAVVDIVQTIRTTPEPPPSLLGDGAIKIVELEPVFDLRPPQPQFADKLVAAVTMVGEQWSTPEKRGVWMMGDVATLDIAVTDGGHRRRDRLCVHDCLLHWQRIPTNALACARVERHRIEPPPSTEQCVHSFTNT